MYDTIIEGWDEYSHNNPDHWAISARGWLFRKAHVDEYGHPVGNDIGVAYSVYDTIESRTVYRVTIGTYLEYNYPDKHIHAVRHHDGPSEARCFDNVKDAREWLELSTLPLFEGEYANM